MADFKCTWWEYVTDDKGELKMSEFKHGIASPIMREIATGRELSGADLPTGALWAGRRRPGCGPNEYPRVGADGLSIFCRHSDGHGWNIEGRASNCTMKDEHDHRCWVRHGTVGERLTVDKNGKTCAAGAGSFFMGPKNEWHGFLRNGKLVQG